MKKILVFSHALEIGGAERALLGLLESFDYTKYSVDLFLMRHTGELMKYIPDEVNLLKERKQYASLAVPISSLIRKGQFAVAMGRIAGKIAAGLKEKRLNITGESGLKLECSHKYTKCFMPKINDTEYDFAISFLTPHYFVAEKVKAKQKIAWIHTDYAIVKVDAESEEKMWGQYDYIASISEAVTDSFVRVFPKLQPKVREIQNILPMKCIRKQIHEFSVEDEMPTDGSVKLLSIGRFCPQKNFDNVPDICRQIRALGKDIKWYLIGFGEDEELVKSIIEKEDMGDFVRILGKKSNPYPYIKACDLYVQPSRYEGNSVTVHEAQMLGKPVVITKYITSASQLEDGEDGVIVPMDNQGCANGIKSVLDDLSLCQHLTHVCEQRDYSNSQEIKKLYQLIERNEE